MSGDVTNPVAAIERLRRDNWNAGPAVRRAELPELITERELFDTIDCGLLCSPYFTVLRDGEPVPAAECTVRRQVLNLTVPGFVHRSAVPAEFHRGAVLAFTAVEQWHRGIAAFLAKLRPLFEAELGVSVVLTPAGAAGGPAKSTRAHRFVLHLTGESRWTAGDRRITASAGDIVYLPYGTPAAVEVADGTALHVVVTVTEPSVTDVVEVVAETLRHRFDTGELARSHHLRSAEDKAIWVRDRIAEYCAEVDVDELALAAADRRVCGS